MLDNLRNRIVGTLAKLQKVNRLSNDVVDETLRQVRRALLEADVALPVTKSFVEQVRKRVTVGEQVSSGTTPQQAMTVHIFEELTEMLGSSSEPLNLDQDPAVILVCGLQGMGKTTTAGKLALKLKSEQRKRVLLVGADVYRPAAIQQLKTLAYQADVVFLATSLSSPVEIVAASIEYAKKYSLDCVIVDTAGRLHIDDEMMSELKSVHRVSGASETLFVVDAMVGQDAVTSAAAFNELLPLTGVVVTKMDGDARGGALLSVRHITGKPVKFIGVGEDLDALEQFHPDRIASRILGMGDVKSLVEKVTRRKESDQKLKSMEEKFRRGHRLNLEDYRDQIMMSQQMGGIANLAKHMPMIDRVSSDKLNAVEIESRRDIAIINSMTKKERTHPAIIRGTRVKRIAAGSGVEPRYVSQLLRKFQKLERMSRKMGRGAQGKKMRNIQEMMQGFPR